MTVLQAPSLFSYRPYWAKRFGQAPFLPMSRQEMDVLGWEVCDIILVTGDAYVDHPSFGAALIGRLLEAQGFRVGVIAQPDWHTHKDFQALGPPQLFFGITSGNMDSMVNRYTADRKYRSDDAYSPDGAGGNRPDRATIVYSQKCRQAYPEIPIILGGIEASLRRLAHYDYWQDKVRRSILLDAKADLILYGNAERAVVALAHHLAQRKPLDQFYRQRGMAYDTPLNSSGNYQLIEATDPKQEPRQPKTWQRAETALRLPGYETVAQDPIAYAHASRIFYHETNPYNARALVQCHQDRDLWITPPPLPLTTEELDRLYALPYARLPHPSYASCRIPAYEMIQHSVTIMRGCFGGCSFCAITAHEGRIIQNRSEPSILHEIETLRDVSQPFTGIISDLGGPTANMYQLGCQDPKAEAACRKLSCIHPTICSRLRTDHKPLTTLYQKARQLPGIKKILIGSGLRYDLAVLYPDYVKALVTHHVGGYLKVAPEHTESLPLQLMMKPPIQSLEKFQQQFNHYSHLAGKEQYLIPYFIAAHPGTRDIDMLHLALWLKQHQFRPDQVQTFLPTPMTLATAMYHTKLNPLKPLTLPETVVIPKGEKSRKLHKAFLRYHAKENQGLLRQALRQMGRGDLIGAGKKHLVR